MQNTNSNETPLFTGWATVEIMGHNQVSGFVETMAFGSTVEIPKEALWCGPPSQRIIDVIKSLTWNDDQGRRYYRKRLGFGFGNWIRMRSPAHLKELNEEIDKCRRTN